MRYYIAYGSNLNKSQMKHRCPGAEVVGTAVMEGWQLLFKGSRTGSYLTIERRKGGKVPVAIWSVTKADERNLDLYEGYPTFYYKKEGIQLNVTRKNGKQEELEAFVYIMHEDRQIAVPDAFYVDTCRRGYDDFGFDRHYLVYAIDRSFAVEKRRYA